MSRAARPPGWWLRYIRGSRWGSLFVIVIPILLWGLPKLTSAAALWSTSPPPALSPRERAAGLEPSVAVFHSFEGVTPSAGDRAVGAVMSAAREILGRGHEGDGALAPRFCIAVSGGSLASVVAPALLDAMKHTERLRSREIRSLPRWMDWSLWHFWFADERYVPVGDVQSNHRAWKELMFDDPTFREFFPVETNVHRVDTALSLKRAAAAYASEFERVCGGEALPEEEGEDLGRQEGKGEHEMGDNSNREVALEGARSPSSGQDEWLPATMHATLLGMGGDGHTASLFPRSVGADGLPVAGMEEAGPSAFCAIEGSPKPPPRRISLTYSAIAGSHSVIFVAGGGGKAAAVRRALQQQESATVPAGVVSRSAGSWAVKAGLVPKAAAAAAEADDEDGPLQQVVRRVVPVSTEMDRLPASAATTTTTAALMAAAKTASGALWILDEDAAAQLDEGWLERVRVWPPRQVVTERKEKKENSAGSALHDEL